MWSQGTFAFLKGTFDLKDRKVVAIRPQRQRGGHKSRISWTHQKLEEARNRITPRDFGGLDFRLPASRPVRIDVCEAMKFVVICYSRPRNPTELESSVSAGVICWCFQHPPGTQGARGIPRELTACYHSRPRFPLLCILLSFRIFFVYK